MNHDLESIQQQIDGLANRSRDNRLWGLIVKLSVLVVYAAAAAIIFHEVRLARAEERMDNLKANNQELRLAITNLPFEKIEVEMRGMKNLMQDMRDRLKELEIKIDHDNKRP